MKKNYHLSSDQKCVIKFLLKQGNSPEKIIHEWDIKIHGRDAPSVQTIYKIKSKMENGDDNNTIKKGPKKKPVLTQKKLDKIEELIHKTPFITYKALASEVGLSKTSTKRGVKLLNFSTYHATNYQILNDDQMEMRKNFCFSFLRWNHQFQMRVWWSDESIFKIEEMNMFEPKTYRSRENQFVKKPKIKKMKSINVWAAIRGDGKLIYEILDDKHNSETYIQLLFNNFTEMESTTSFLMQDGAGLHTSDDAVDWINFLWKDRWIGLKSKRLEFPPYSMDLTPMDFSFWGNVKRMVGLKFPNNTEELKIAIVEVLNNFENDMIIRMCNDVRERCQKCFINNGGRFE